MKRIDLMESEQAFICFDVLPGIASVTFFKGTPPIDYLKQRTQEIVHTNPWLCAKPSKKGGVKHLVHPDPEDKNDLPDLFRSFDDSNDDNDFERIDPSRPYDEICSAALPLTIKKGSDVTEDDPGSFLVSVVNHPSKKTFALVVSLSHVVGDGHTFYAVHNMLSTSGTVEALIPSRDCSFLEQQKQCMGEDMAKGVTDTPLIVRSLMGVLKLKLYTKTLVRQLYYVDNDYIQDQKKNYKEEQPRKDDDDDEKAAASRFISTNDILTSWFYSAAKTQYSLMAINLRNRIKSITDKHAANYENFIVFQHDDYQEPAMIRKAVDSCGKDKAYPGAWQRMWSGPFAVCANWSTFDGGIDLPGDDVEQILHIPLYPEDSLQADLNLGIIFRPTRGKLAMLLMSDRGIMVGKGPLSEPLELGSK